MQAFREVAQLVKFGTNGCINAEHAVSYPVNHDPGISLDQLFREPDQQELDAVLAEWNRKDLSLKDVRLEREDAGAEGTMQVISHSVNGQKHYGFIYLQPGLHIATAPILLLLPGKAGQYDVFKTDFLQR